MPPTHRYTIEIKDDRPWEIVTFVAVDWTDSQKQAAIDQMRGWVGSEPTHGRHSIEVADAETGERVLFAMADWTDGQLSAVARRVLRWTGVPDAIDFPDSGDALEVPPKAANDDDGRAN